MEVDNVMSYKNFWRKINAQIDDRILRVMAGRSHKSYFFQCDEKDSIFQYSIVPSFQL
jgi:hypothetical protein